MHSLIYSALLWNMQWMLDNFNFAGVFTHCSQSLKRTSHVSLRMLKDCWDELIRCVTSGSAAAVRNCSHATCVSSSSSLRHQDLPLHGLRDGEARQPQNPGSARAGLHGLHSGQQQQLRRGVSGRTHGLPMPPLSHPAYHYPPPPPQPFFITPINWEGSFFFLFPHFFFKVNWCFFWKACVGRSGSPDNPAWLVSRWTRFVVPSSRALCDFRRKWRFTMKVSISLLRQILSFLLLRTKASPITMSVEIIARLFGFWFFFEDTRQVLSASATIRTFDSFLLPPHV